MHIHCCFGSPVLTILLVLQLDQVRRDFTAGLSEKDDAHSSEIQSTVAAMEEAGTALVESQAALAEKERLHEIQVRDAVKTAVARALKDSHHTQEQEFRRSAEAERATALALKDGEHQRLLDTALQTKDKVHTAALKLALRAKDAEHANKMQARLSEVLSAKEQVPIIII